ncbi:hypothetical protein PVOR_04468 [Paenibacillus vortex V453]|uniref:Uncharacterized protein n=1 Tax=Paenibacillus vortex V453 TaxID=715225 RepID=A0A2R9T0U1_9BACL|nr:hypothetical protein PVOR_04468 [Paenibacillus vortex V453]
MRMPANPAAAKVLVNGVVVCFIVFIVITSSFIMDIYHV